MKNFSNPNFGMRKHAKKKRREMDKINKINIYDTLSSMAHAYIPQQYHLPTYLQQWVPGITPLSTLEGVTSAIVAYLAIIFGGRELMRGREPFKLKIAFQLHNTVLYVGSGVLLALMAEEVVPMIYKHGFYYSICSEEAWTDKLEFYYIINYYFKYIELIDTVFLVLKKKPLAFLHVFHHAATAALCYTQLEGRTAVSWVVISLNLAVHVLMYYYYYATAGGARIWWKKYLTTMQITQFIIDIFIVYFATYQHYGYRWGWPHVGDCTGSRFAAFCGCGLLTSYLFLFIAFYVKTYKSVGRRTSVKKAVTEAGTAPVPVSK
ncbi:hypothetical protein E3P86_02965 [Wallemia ichthyophaga]|uniref:Elongation of fatty acids protein n=1 Tax=Wallemia ichthyophaga TaxID=245174 RepID=A0A4T0IWB3_WALIC|nr:hypothetical protein E3P86_02965 [Wallemia ichthyophaga]